MYAYDNTWDKVGDNYFAMTGVTLPARPPTADQIDYMKKKLLATEGLLGALLVAFTKASVAQARHHGNLLGGIEPDWLGDSERNTIYGDGTIFKRHSDVTTLTDPITGEVVFLGSRATDPRRVRMQRFLTDTSQDGKDLHGINHVSVHTWTPQGRVVLGVDHATGAEIWPALDLIDAVAELTGDGIHRLVWDRVFTGWPVEYLWAARRIMTVNKNVARSSNDTAIPIQAAGLDEATLLRRAERLGAEVGAEPTAGVAHLLSRGLLRDALLGGDALPLGTSVYKTTKGHEVVAERVYELDPISHAVDDTTCTHALYVDGGALYDVEAHPVHGHLVKIAKADCVGVRVDRTPTGHTAAYEWVLPCGQTQLTHTTTWAPDGSRYRPEDTHRHDRTKRQMAMTELRPISRADGDKFNDIHGRRNDSESYNAWAKRHTHHHGRAASTTLDGQRLDFLMIAMFNNSITWKRLR